MPLPLVVDYVYIFDRGGSLFELNTDVLPFWDVNHVTGLDMGTWSPIIDEYDGQHGGSAYIKWSDPRTIVVEGALYADPTAIETEVERVNGLVLPDNVVRKFWYKHPGQVAKYLNTKTTGMKYDIDTGRRIGIMPYQLQLLASDPRKYTDATPLTLADNVPQTATNSGTVVTYPLLTISGDFINASIVNITDGKTLTLTYDTTGSETITVDFLRRTVRNATTDISSSVTGTWWGLITGANSVKVDITTGSPTMTFNYTSGWL